MIFMLACQARPVRHLASCFHLVDASTVEVRDGQGLAARLTVDPQSGLPTKLAYQGIQMGGPPVEVEETWADYRDFNGVRLPTRITITQGGQKFAETTIDAWRLNTGLQAAELEKKP